MNFVDKFAKKLIARGQMEGIDFECSNGKLKCLGFIYYNLGIFMCISM